jgi:hypothetical protein
VTDATALRTSRNRAGDHVSTLHIRPSATRFAADRPSGGDR